MLMSFALQAMMQDMPWYRQGFFMGAPLLLWLIIIATIAVLLWALWRATQETRELRRQMRERLAAEEALHDRLARGEIDQDEFVRRMQTLESAHAGEL